MAMFLKEEPFLDYLNTTYPTATFTKHHTILSVNIVRLQPIMSFIYYDGQQFAAARYNRQFEVFTDHLYLPDSAIRTFSSQTKGFTQVLRLTTTADMVLSFSANTFTSTKWHNQNLKQLHTLIDQRS